NRLQLKIPPRFNQARRSPFLPGRRLAWRAVSLGRRGLSFSVRLPILQILLRGSETIGNKCPHTHPRLGKPRDEPLTPIRLLHIFTQRELDARRRGFEDQLVRTGAVAQLDHAILAANW